MPYFDHPSHYSYEGLLTRCPIWSQYQGHVWFKMITTYELIFCSSWQSISLSQVFHNNSLQINTAYWTLYSCILRLSLKAHQIYWLKRASLAHVSSTWSIHNLGHDGCKFCHIHNIRCMNNTLTLFLTWTQDSSMGQGWHHKTYTLTSTYCARWTRYNVPALIRPYNALTIIADLPAFSPYSLLCAIT